MVIKNLLKFSSISRKNVVLIPRKTAITKWSTIEEDWKMDITYHEENGYLIPNIVLAPGCDTSTPIGKYGRIQRRYLQEHRPVLFSVMVQNGTLLDHLIETKEAARSRLDVMIPELAKFAGATERLKAVEQMKWV